MITKHIRIEWQTCFSMCFWDLVNQSPWSICRKSEICLCETSPSISIRLLKLYFSLSAVNYLPSELNTKFFCSSAQAPAASFKISATALLDISVSLFSLWSFLGWYCSVSRAQSSLFLCGSAQAYWQHAWRDLPAVKFLPANELYDAA